MMGFEGDHPSHFLGITLYSGHYENPLEEVPQKAKKWKMGQPISYLIDFLESDEIVYRIFVQTSNGPYPYGYIPKTLMNEKSIDIAILSLAVKGKKIRMVSQLIDYLNPELIFLGHWENFMRAKDKPLKAVSKSNISKHWKYLKERYPDEPKLILPKPGSKFQIN